MYSPITLGVVGVTSWKFIKGCVSRLGW